MSFYLLFLCGFLGGVFGGMGMGGGTALIPLLTLLCGVPQRAAQGLNLLSFLPMAAFALSAHAKNGLLETKGLGWIIVPAVASSVLGALIAVWLPPVLLRKGFGLFLTVLALRGLSSFLSASSASDGGSSAKKCKKDEKFSKRV